MDVREYGAGGPTVVLLHGGPGAPGSLEPLARALSDRFRVLEPMQRRSGPVPLTVARHVDDLADLIAGRCAAAPPLLVGHSWGAMLALAFGAAHPNSAAALVLIGCGTFDPAARRRLEAEVDRRMIGVLGERVARLEEVVDPDERLNGAGEILARVYAYDRVEDAPEFRGGDARGHDETWDDMVRLQASGVYPAAFAAIGTPVLMLHGSHDPHPGPLIRESLRTALPQLEYREFDRCGHEPWLERAARDEFLAVLRPWLASHALYPTPRRRTRP
jgi:pimeloyl-ACP methyl ester carboxylesterase